MAGMRTKKGNVTAKARRRAGDKSGKYPMFDAKSIANAIRLRHHGKGVSPEEVLARAMRAITRLLKAGKISQATAERLRRMVAEARDRDQRRKR